MNHSPSRVFGLDLLRAIAIINVVIIHGQLIVEGTALQNFPFFSMIDGVDIFFALSGYLIGKILIKEIQHGFRVSQLLNFWKRRWFRTLPNYYLILLLNVLVVKYGIIHEYISEFNWKFLVFLQNFNKPFMGFFWESWTLTVEEWFYIFSPLLLIVFSKFLKPKWAFIITAVLMIALPIIHRISIYSPLLEESQWHLIHRKLVLNRLDSLAYGLVAAWLFFYSPQFWHFIRYISLAASFMLMYFILHHTSDVKTFYTQVIQVALSPISAMLLLPYAESLKISKGLFGKGITHISIISYSMYLINGALVAEVIRDNFMPVTTQEKYLTYLVYWAVVIGVSSLIYKFYEKPIMDLRDKKIDFLGLNKKHESNL